MMMDKSYKVTDHESFNEARKILQEAEDKFAKLRENGAPDEQDTA